MHYFNTILRVFDILYFHIKTFLGPTLIKPKYLSAEQICISSDNEIVSTNMRLNVRCNGRIQATSGIALAAIG